MKKIIRAINAIFIKIVLLIFYIFIIGISVLIYRIINKPTVHTDSYWDDEREKLEEVNYFQSPY